MIASPRTELVLDLPWNASAFEFATGDDEVFANATGDDDAPSPGLRALAGHGVVALRRGDLKLLYAVGNETWYAAESDDVGLAGAACPVDSYTSMCDTSETSLGAECAYAYLFDVSVDPSERANLWHSASHASARAALEQRALALTSRAGGTSGGSGSTKTTEKAADDIFYDAGDYIVPFGCAAEW